MCVCVCRGGEWRAGKRGGEGRRGKIIQLKHLKEHRVHSLSLSLEMRSYIKSILSGRASQ